ncbi:tetratricopeptide repeat protein, partial [Parafilimonas sp.]|uniref:tetratricopeptide repeat protein n=1 Tax=Parafilimonas sp. TaxID=1969739 RepID=UPI0039E32902
MQIIYFAVHIRVVLIIFTRSHASFAIMPDKLFIALTFTFLFIGCKIKNDNAENMAANSSNSPRINAITFLHDGKFDEAEIAFKKAIKAEPGNILNYLDLSLIYLNKNKFADVEKLVQDGLKIQPGNTDLMQILA